MYAFICLSQTIINSKAVGNPSSVFVASCHVKYGEMSKSLGFGLKVLTKKSCGSLL